MDSSRRRKILTAALTGVKPLLPSSFVSAASTIMRSRIQTGSRPPEPEPPTPPP